MLDHFLDIYSKLLIGVISFIAPLTSYLLSTYLNDRQILLDRLKGKKDALDILIDEAFKQGKQAGLTPQILESGNAILKNKESETTTNLNRIKYLNPKVRISWLFAYLITSMLTLLTDSLIRGNVLDTYNHQLSIALLIISCSTFAFATIILIRVVWKLIESKELISLEKSKEIVVSQNIVNANVVNDVENELAIPVEPEN